MTDPHRRQRRGRRIAMTDAERDDFLHTRRTARVATTGPDGPHVAPLWFVWDGAAAWLYSLTRSQRWTDLERDPRVALVVDVGEDYDELRGVEIRGSVEVVGEVPRTGAPCEPLAPVEARFGAKYGGGQFGHDGRHAWLRVTPAKITSWDFRKL